MSDLPKLRASAELLLNLGKYEEAYHIYDEVYSKILHSLGTVQNGMAKFSREYLIHNIRSSIEFRNSYIMHAANTTARKWFNLDIDELLNELTFTMKGRLQCICYSLALANKSPVYAVYSEFLALFYLVIYNTDENWLGYFFKFITPVVDDVGLKKIHSNMQHSTVSRMLVESAEKINETDWFLLNVLVLEYMEAVGKNNTEMFHSIRRIVGPYYTKHREKYKRSRHYKKASDYEKYEKYEKYERYEKYEKYEQKGQTAGSKDGFDINKATEEEKARYFGRLLGLSGRVSKVQIRKKYLELISKYHPDKVSNLGPELVELAESKTKEINTAFEWFRKKYQF